MAWFSEPPFFMPMKKLGLFHAPAPPLFSPPGAEWAAAWKVMQCTMHATSCGSCTSRGGGLLTR